MEEKKKEGFGSKVGFVLAAAGSAVGLGNIWRFPYLAAKYGGGIFLLVYIILVVTFGFSLMVTEISIGRRTGKSEIGAYKEVDRRFGFLGPFASLVPFIITPYYCVIGGWVLKYLVTFGLQLFMYATPIIYPMSVASDKYRHLLELNPLTSIFEAFKYSCLDCGTLSWGGLLYSTIFMLIMLFFSVIVFTRVERNFMDTV